MTARVFVGTDANGGCAENQMVFEYSLRKHASIPVDIVWMKISDDPSSFWYGWNTSNYSTPFSAFRYGIPAYCNFQGKAIYCDDDQLWLSDVAKLWNQDVSKYLVLNKGPHYEDRTCVSLWNCEKAKPLFPSIEELRNSPILYKQLETAIALNYPVLCKQFKGDWNNFDGEDKASKDIDLLHFTAMDTNPGIELAVKRLGSQSKHWYDGPINSHRRPDIVSIFHKYYSEALEAGYRVENYVPEKKLDYTKLSQKDYKANNGWD